MSSSFSSAGAKTTYNLLLPKTAFGLRGRLPEKEPRLLAHWKTVNLEAQRLKVREGAPRFTLHDGPPYANGHLHLGHAVNKIAKDVAVRFWQMQGRHAAFTPGWDCHGLPIEAKVEEAFQEKGQDKKELSPLTFRKACRTFANRWIDVQRDEFTRMGLLGDFAHPYTTMAPSSEATIVRAFLDLVEKGLVYRGLRPVLWSVVEETALAEAEVEYKDVTSPSLYVSFPLKKAAHPLLQDARAMIWTTTPWTLPANRAIAYGDMMYAVIKLTDTGTPSPLVIGKPCLERFQKDTGLTFEVLGTVAATDLEGCVAAHPLHKDGYDFDVPLVPAAHVSADAGTGLVHTAPAHGTEDFSLAKPYNLEVTDLITPDGRFKPDVPLFAGTHIYKAKEPVREALDKAGALVWQGTLQHSYPHSWRSRTPLIYRATPQWFLRLDGTPSVRQKALEALNDVTFLPESGRARLTSMLERRPDWCLSRQRSWGIPLMLFIDEDGKPLMDAKLNAQLVELVQQEGTDVWWTDKPQTVLKHMGYEGYTTVTDILDVWFESGASHLFALDETQRPADLYLEGSDQHRGWFQSSLLLSIALNDKAPYTTLLTHGFVVDAEGRKMSKSLGNSTTPAALVQSKGADVLRLWVLSSDLDADIKVSPQTMAAAEETYRRLRGTLRFLLGNSQGNGDTTPTGNPPVLEHWVLARLQQVGATWTAQMQAYRFDQALTTLHHFCANDLSAFYFDVRKDALYCEAAHAPLRQHVVATLQQLLDTLLTLLAPFIPFTTEEAFLEAKTMGGRTTSWPDSVHLVQAPVFEVASTDQEVCEKMIALRQLRSVITAALEEHRSAGRLRSSLESNVILYIADAATRALLDDFTASAMAELCLTSALTLGEAAAPADAFRLEGVRGVAVAVAPAKDVKCPRCWRYVVPHEAVDALCARCKHAEAAV